MLILGGLYVHSPHINAPGEITCLADVIFSYVHMRVNNKNKKNNMSAENVETLVESQNFIISPSNKKKTYGRETETDIEKRKKFQWIEEMVAYLLYFRKRYKLMCDFSEKDFHADKPVQYSKLRKKWKRKEV